MTILAGVPVATHNHPAACADSGYLLIKLCFLDHAVFTMRVGGRPEGWLITGRLPTRGYILPSIQNHALH